VTATVLIVDDDRDIRTFVEVSLRLADFETLEAADGEEGLAMAVAHTPDVIVLDVMMPKMDGFTALRRIRRDGRISHIPVILLTAKAQTHDKLTGFEAGADDYLTKPFDPSELVARVQASLRRAADMRAIQPLTGLPGNTAIDKEVARRVDHGEPFALMHADLNNFKAYNDHYGYGRGDDVLRAFARILVECAREIGGAETFVGHVGGDDFVVVTDPGLFEPMAKAICTRFDATVPELYDIADRETGGIVVQDRQGDEQTYPLVAVSIGVALARPGGVERPEQAVAVANELKQFAKRQVRDGGSNYEFDRRATPGS
jgi:diguanylate cyclase (GGDEF)-like protein